MTDHHDHIYLHGTSPISAVCIAEEGFRVLDRETRRWHGHLGTGIYVTRNPETVYGFSGPPGRVGGSYVLEVEIERGTRIAMLDDSPDPKVIGSLRREFGHEILGPGFERAIPQNKHLKPRELFALLAHLDGQQALVNETARRTVRRWLARLKYDGYGHTRNDLGILVYNADRIRLRSIQWWRQRHEEWNRDDPDPFVIEHPDPPKIAADAEAHLEAWDEDLREEAEDPEPSADLPGQRAELERRRSLLDRYRNRYNLA